jgi:hypothetical protein
MGKKRRPGSSPSPRRRADPVFQDEPSLSRRGSKTVSALRGIYIHRPVGEEVRAIGGSYTLEKEMKLPHAGREVLLVLGHAFIDSSCCGVAGCRYVFVPGYLKRWHDRENEEGLPVSTVESIRDPVEQRAIEKLIRKEELIHSIEFW